MKRAINTTNGVYEFEQVLLYHGRKKINKDIAKNNLFDTAEIIEKHGIRYGLIYGTLLGAIRNGDFIEWDEDVDLFVFDEDRKKLIDSLHELKFKGLEVVRYDGDLLSLMRRDDYIDIYFFRKTIMGSRVCGSDSLPRKYFNKLSSISFLEKNFPTLDMPEDFLAYAYGLDWKTPKKNIPADVRSRFARVKMLVRKFVPNLILNAYSKHFIN